MAETKSASTRWVGRLVQVVLTVLVTWIIFRFVGLQLEDLRTVDLGEWRPDFPLLIASCVLLLMGYFASASVWGLMVLDLGGPRLRFGTSVRIFMIANLGRYLPGKVWAVAGMAILAGRAGISGYAAVGSAIAMQALALGSGVAIVALFGLDATPVAAVAVSGGLGAMIILALVLPAPARWIKKVTGRNFQPLPPLAAFSGAAATTASWMLYGAAFWFLARGLGLQLEFRVATTAFTFYAVRIPCFPCKQQKYFACPLSS